MSILSEVLEIEGAESNSIISIVIPGETTGKCGVINHNED